MNESKEETESNNKKTSEKEHCPFLCDNIMEAEEALEVRPWQGLRVNISMPIEEISPLDVHKSSQAVATVKTFPVSENDISKVYGEMSDHSLAVTDFLNLEQALMSNNIMEAEESLAVRPWQGLRDNTSMPIEEVFPLGCKKGRNLSHERERHL
ncbi:uncharacterized protein LOC144661936 isoform X3 [Oculina patagonica]